MTLEPPALVDEALTPVASGGGPLLAPNGSEMGFQAVDWSSAAVTAGVSFLVYWYHLAPDLTLEWSGMLATSAWYGGVARAPGHPVWSIYAGLFTWFLPWGNVAWRVAMSSAVAAALASGLVALVVSRGGALLTAEADGADRGTSVRQSELRRVTGIAAGLLFAFTNPLWHEAEIASFWAFDALLFNLVLTWLLGWLAQPARTRFLAGAFLVYGLLLTSLPEMVVLLPVMFLVVNRTDPELGRDLFLAGGAVLGLWFTLGAGRFESLLYFYAQRNLWLSLGFLLAGGLAMRTAVTTRRIGSAWRPALACALAMLLGIGLCLYPALVSLSNPPINWGYPRKADEFVKVVLRTNFGGPDAFGIWGDVVGAKFWIVGRFIGSELGLALLFLIPPALLYRRFSKIGRHWLCALILLSVGLGPLLAANLNSIVDRSTMLLMAPFFCPLLAVLAIWAGLGVIMLVHGEYSSKAERH